MANTLPRANPPISRPSPSSNSTSPIARGVSRVSSSFNSPVTRRSSLKIAPSSPVRNPDARDLLSASLKQETEQKEQLMIQVQNKDQIISHLTTENENLTCALSAAETRLNELYEEQNRSELELANRIDVSEKLRFQLREFEKEKRDLQRRYNEQTFTFDAERQAFYDNEQHLKSRIQSLSQARKQPEPHASLIDIESDTEPEIKDNHLAATPQGPTQHFNGLDTEPAEMTSLRLELSTLSTSYTSLQSTLVLLQTQLVDLKRVNHELQEENESYMILLREKTLSGQFDLMKQVGNRSSVDDVEDDEDSGEEDQADLRSAGLGTLDTVEEEIHKDGHKQGLETSLEPRDLDSSTSARISHHTVRQGRRRLTFTSQSSEGPHGESLADLPITGPGLDLAAELGRAQNKNILIGDAIRERDNKGTKGKKTSPRRPKFDISNGDVASLSSDVDALRTEVKSLKDANKALSLYASKIIDRIIATEGFEHVLAVDYDKLPNTPTSAPAFGMEKPTTDTTIHEVRSQSVIVGRSSSNPMPEMSKFGSSPITLQHKLNLKVQRRSLSFDWRNFSLFNSSEKKPENSSLRPLTLKPGATSVTGARKLDAHEDEEDLKERERLNATMKLMGIQPERFSFSGARSIPADSDMLFVHSTPSFQGDDGNAQVGLGISGSSNLTQEALEQAEAENSLAALDAHERNLSAEIARGNASGFTEVSPRGHSYRRSMRSGDSSRSTVWSAGMSCADEED